MERELWQKSHEIAQCYKRYWLLLSFESDITSFVFFLDVELLNWRLLKLRYCLGHQTWENQYKVINTNIIYIYIYIYNTYCRNQFTIWEIFHNHVGVFSQAKCKGKYKNVRVKCHPILYEYNKLSI